MDEGFINIPISRYQDLLIIESRFNTLKSIINMPIVREEEEDEEVQNTKCIGD